MAHNREIHLSPLCVAFALAHFGAGSADGKKRGGSTAARGESGWKGKNAWGGKERGDLLSSFFWASGPHPTSPVSPIVLHHNGGRLIILKTADYQSGRFQGPTSKQSQQYRTEREFLQQFGPLQIKKDPKPTQPAISFYTNPRTRWKCHC